MSDEIKAAAERLVAGNYYGDGGNLADALRDRKADGLLVANAYLAGLKIPTKQQQNDTSNPETEVTNA